MKKLSKKILLTGGAGFIGSHLVDAYLEAGYQVVVIEDLSSGKKTNLNLRAKFYLADICDFKKTNNIILKEKPDFISLHAAQIKVLASNQDPVADAQINILANLNILQTARQLNNLKKIIFASSGGAIYATQATLPAKETALIQPKSAYGVAKSSIELYLAAYYQNYKIPYVALRYANVFGPRQKADQEGGVVAIFIKNFLQQKSPSIYGNGQQTRDFIYVKDVVTANLLATKSKFVGALNISSQKEISILTLAELIKNKTQSAKTIRFTQARVGEQSRSCLNHNLAKKVLSWKNGNSLETEIEETIAWFKTHV